MGSFLSDIFRPDIPSNRDAVLNLNNPRQSRITLEPRMLFDGSVVATADSPTDEPQTNDADQPVAVNPGSDANAEPSALLVIDPSVDDWQTLVEDLDPDTAVLVLDPNESGVSQIAQAMLENGTISELHIVSHGTAGQITIGNESLNSSNLDQYSEDLAAIGSQLTESGDILLYGCNVGDGNAGAQFLAAVARATSADVAGSIDLTGSADLGGDWNLEVVTGEIEADIAISAQAQNAFTGLLMPVATASLADSSEAATTGSIVAPGEVVRLRMVVDIPDGVTTGAELRPDLAPGLRFANDGSTTIALVSDNGFTTTVPGPSAQVVGGGASAVDVAGITPTQQLDSAMITDGAGGALPAGLMASGADPVFELGDLTNTDGADADSEFIIIEFNAIVENEAVNNFTAGASPFSFEFHGNGALEDTSNIHDLFVSEPAIFDVSKVVISVVGNQITYEVTFSNTGALDAHNVRVYEDFAGAVNQTFGSLSSAPPGTINNSDADTLDLEIPVVAGSGGSVTVTYTATATDPTIDVPVTDVEVTYTSLSTAGEDLTANVEDGVGTPTVVTTSTTGERTGVPTDYGGAENDYRQTESAGLGYIAGQLWEDVDQSDTIDAGETLLQGVTVNMVWAGADGIFGNGDDQNYSTTTDVDGRYQFGLLPGGDYRMTTDLTVTHPSIGVVRNTFDRSATGPQGDGITEHSLFEGEVCTDHDFGYTRQNEAPVITPPAAAQSVDEEAKLTMSGANAIVISDPDSTETGAPAPFPSTYEVVLAVTNGTLDATAAGTAVVTGTGTNSVTISGSLADINSTLDGLCYTGDTDFCGTDNIDVTVNDGGTFGEVDNDGTPSEPVDDNLSANAMVAITVNNLPDAPTANADAQTTDETTAVSGNALTGVAGGDVADTDPDLACGDSLSVCGVVAGSGAAPIDSTGVGTSVAGTYGDITVDALGNYTYTPGAAAVALNSGDTVQDVFTYSVCDSTGNTVQTTITITINGADNPNTPPDAVDTTFTITEDLISEGGTPLMFSASDFGFSDIDPGDSFQSVCIVTVPSSGTLALNGVAVTAGQEILVADIADLTYTPAADANNENLGAAPNFTFAVVDSQSNKDPVPNTITINILPEHTDVPPLPSPEPSIIEPEPRSSVLPNRETRGPTPYSTLPGYFYEPGDVVFERIVSEPVEMSMFSAIASARPWQTIGDLQEKKQQAIVKAASEAHVDDDCEPMKPVKAKPSVVKRAILGEPKEKPASFSEQIKKQKPTVKPRKPARIC